MSILGDIFGICGYMYVQARDASNCQYMISKADEHLHGQVVYFDVQQSGYALVAVNLRPAIATKSRNPQGFETWSYSDPQQ